MPLVLEYEATAKKHLRATGLSVSDIDAIVDYICDVAKHYKIYYLWRPFLSDPKDDMVLELAVVSTANPIVSYNGADFKRIEKFGLGAIKRGDFLKEIGELKRVHLVLGSRILFISESRKLRKGTTYLLIR